jgi:regulator of nonsense transcripts 1
LQAASKAEHVRAPILDGVVIQVSRGEFIIELIHPPPPEMERIKWNMYNAGSIGGYFSV